MTDAQLLALLEAVKIDLGIVTDRYDTRLKQMIQASAEMIREEGATLNFDSYKDCQIVEMYACWLWRRRDTGEGMPRMLRYALNNRIFGEKMRKV